METVLADFHERHSGLLSDLLAQYTRFVEESPPLGERQMPERLQHLLRMVRVTGRNYLNERPQLVTATGKTRDQVLELICKDADAWLKKHGPKQPVWQAPFAELETVSSKR